MQNPFEIIEARLSNIENLLLDLKHPLKETSPPSEEDQLLTIQQASEFLNLTKQTIYGYVHRSQITVYKRQKRLYFSKQDLIKWVKDGRKKTSEEIMQAANEYINKKGLKYGK